MAVGEPLADPLRGRTGLYYRLYVADVESLGDEVKFDRTWRADFAIETEGEVLPVILRDDTHFEPVSAILRPALFWPKDMKRRFQALVGVHPGGAFQASDILLEIGEIVDIKGVHTGNGFLASTVLRATGTFPPPE